MLFHLGSLLRLCEIGYLGGQSIPAHFGKLERVSSVSGGAITAAVCGKAWSSVRPTEPGCRSRFLEHVVTPVRKLASKIIDITSVLTGMLPRTSIANRVVAAYRKHLFGTETLEAFPERPCFEINATSLQSGYLWRFMQARMPAIEIATAVGASSAFPLFLSPVRLEFETFRTRRQDLADGGVYDNLGIETVWKDYWTVLVSDAGGGFSYKESIWGTWLLQSYRVLNVIDNQVRSLRKQQLIQSFIDGRWAGAYWSICSNIRDYDLPDALPCPFEKTSKLAALPTRLKALKTALQERPINWGYAACDAAIRKHFDPSIARPADFPYPDQGVG
jgi:NTE family protein